MMQVFFETGEIKRHVSQMIACNQFARAGGGRLAMTGHHQHGLSDTRRVYWVCRGKPLSDGRAVASRALHVDDASPIECVPALERAETRGTQMIGSASVYAANCA